MFCYTILVCSFGFYVLAGGLAFLWNINKHINNSSQYFNLHIYEIEYVC